MADFLRYFRRDVEEEIDERRERAERSASVRRVMSEPFYVEMTSWIEGEADRPVPLSDERVMIQSAVRANTFKEVRDYLRRRKREAESPDLED